MQEVVEFFQSMLVLCHMLYILPIERYIQLTQIKQNGQVLDQWHLTSW